MKRTSLLLIPVAAITSSLACIALMGGSDEKPPIAQDTPTIAVFSSPSPEPSLAVTPIPIPQFEESIILYGYGGGGAFCQFPVPPAPSVIGGTVYFVEPVSEPVHLGEHLYPRGADLCISGAPQDQPVQIKLISPDQQVSLTAEIEIRVNPLYEFIYDVYWTGYPDSWSLENGEHLLGVGAGKENAESPLDVELSLWWAGFLAKGTWQVEVSWAGQTIDGEFYANTRNLPEISLYDPRFESQILPNVDGFLPYTCHMAVETGPYRAIVENASPNSLMYVLVYSISPEPAAGGEKASLYYQASVNTDGAGNGTVELATTFLPGGKYYVFGVPEGVSSVAWNDGFQENAFSFAAIANAMDCFIMP